MKETDEEDLGSWDELSEALGGLNASDEADNVKQVTGERRDGGETTEDRMAREGPERPERLVSIQNTTKPWDVPHNRRPSTVEGSLEKEGCNDIDVGKLSTD